MGKAAELNELLAPLVRDLGYEFVGLVYNPRGKHALLRLYIDREGGITVDECAEVSGEVSALLDVHDPIKNAYTLEVSSPGVDRPLFTPEHFERFAGERARVNLVAPLDGRRRFDGLILGVDGDDIEFEQDGDKVRLPFADISKANLVADI